MPTSKELFPHQKCTRPLRNCSIRVRSASLLGWPAVRNIRDELGVYAFMFCTLVGLPVRIPSYYFFFEIGEGLWADSLR